MEEHNHKHNHEHKHEEGSKISRILYLLSIILFLVSFIPAVESFKVVIYLAVVILAGYDLILSGIKNIFKFNFEESTLMTIAVVAAFALGEYPESCMVVLLFKLGEFLEEKAVEKSNKNIKDIVEIKVSTANIKRQQGEIEVEEVEKIKVGEIILIKPGERIPLDCKIVEGNSTIDTASITGESKPISVKKEDDLLSGSINLTGSLTCIVTKDDKNSTASQIVKLVYEATNNKGKTEAIITKFSKIYTPIVIILAILVAIIPTVFLGQDMKEWIMRALVFLVASCPCSIIISVPLAFFSCIGTLSKKGMLLKGTKHIENLAKAKVVAFDKTGTITTGKMEIEDILACGEFTPNEILVYLYNLELNSNHPISTAIVRKVEKEGIKKIKTVENNKEIAGHGIYGEIEGKQILFGNKKLLEKYQVEIEKTKENANYIAINGKYQGYITLREEVRKDAIRLAQNLKQIGIEEAIMLTGDNRQNAEKIAQKIQIEKIEASLLPQQKLEKVNLLKEKGKVIFVGDGINDSPVLAASDFGIAMGEGTEIAGSTADGILISNQIGTLPEMIKVARKSVGIITFNIGFSLAIKAVVFILGLTGIAPIWLAILADTGVSLITVLNAVRIFSVEKSR